VREVFRRAAEFEKKQWEKCNMRKSKRSERREVLIN